MPHYFSFHASNFAFIVQHKCRSLRSISPLASLAGSHAVWFLAGTMRNLCGYYAIITPSLCHTISASKQATSP